MGTFAYEMLYLSIGIRSVLYGVQSCLVYQTCLPQFSWGALLNLQVYSCTLSFILLAAKKSFKFVVVMVIFHCQKTTVNIYWGACIYFRISTNLKDVFRTLPLATHQVPEPGDCLLDTQIEGFLLFSSYFLNLLYSTSNVH